ncbi:MAG: hypothetical protein FJW34_09820 [Acidobacteria bacterium]|nr:hypothetical protein [Acidobacteriota bacterium]
MGGTLLWSRPLLERRKHRRVSADLRCFRRASPKAPGQYIGCTENLSRNGVLIRWERDQTDPELPRVGDGIALEVEWPVRRGSEWRYLWCRGRVVRVRRISATGPALVAVCVYGMRFRGTVAAEPVWRKTDGACAGPPWLM